MIKLKRSIFCSCLMFSQISCYSLHSGLNMNLVRLPATDDIPIGSLSGRVLDSNNTPIQGAKVTVSEEGHFVSSTISDKSGNYALSGLPLREYSVNASADGFRADTYMVRVIQNTDMEYTFVLTSLQ